MAVDLTGIRSENEFYTQHYLAAIFEGDLADWRTALHEQAERQPHETVRGLSREFNKMRDEWQRSRNTELRLNEQRTFLHSFFTALGYNHAGIFMEEIESGQILPMYCEVKHGNGTPWLWIMEAFDVTDDDSDLLELSLHAGQLTEVSTIADAECNWADYASLIFSEPEPPRWLLLAGHTQVVLLDRTKWNAKRLLRFDLNEIYSRKDVSTFQAMTALLARASLCPPEGDPLLDTWDENSHKHAFSVSGDLKCSLRESIELLGNEVVQSLKQSHERVYDRQLADQLSIQCLRFMYRILFLLYVESRPDLEYVPVKSRTFLTGYSLDSLRNLEMVQLTTEEARNGTYFHDTVQTLFRMIYHGFPVVEEHGSLHHDLDDSDFGFTITPLAAHLFDPDRTPLINKTKLSNEVMQRIIQLMSLSRESGNGQRGRISYAQLGINQLGAVYESLLSYRGFFAETDLFEVKKAGSHPTDLEIAYFATEDQLSQYADDEKVYVDGGARLRKHPRGEFIYRLAGRDRQTSASYYTPEVLTQCLVKYSLKELLKEKTADEILELTVCEPAMGSAAFLNEAVNQLAEAYIERKEKETGKSVPHNERTQELQKVKMFIADRNVYGVDLNPIAVELAEVSLWLNTIYKGAFVPWFGRQLHCGNSLIGARRQVFAPGLLRPAGNATPSWLSEAPARVMPDHKRENGAVYHFLTPDAGMANYTDKVIKDLKPEEIRLTKDWIKDMKKPFTADEVKSLQRLSDRIDELWQQHTNHLQEVQRRTSEAMSVFGHEEKLVQLLPNQMKDKIYREEVLSENIRRSSPYRRLKLVMDYWCALWFWPIEKAEELPTRSQWMLDLSLVLDGNVYDAEEVKELSLFPETMPKEQAIKLFELGGVNLVTLCEKMPRLQLVNQIAERYRFLHWELEFAEIFSGRGGFDLVLGNPPWIKVEWEEGSVLGDADPFLVLRSMTATQMAQRRRDTLEAFDLIPSYLAAFEEAMGQRNFLNALQNYPDLVGSQSNLYKCFLPQAWSIGRQDSGISGFVHPEGPYDDAQGSRLRRVLYPKLASHFGFINELKRFADVHHLVQYSINIYQNKKSSEQVEFNHINNLYHPKTIDECFQSNGSGLTPGIKNEKGKWNVQGHKNRILKIGPADMRLFATLYDAEGTPPQEARLPMIHSIEQISVLRKIADYSPKLSEVEEDMYSTEFWHETNSQNDHTLEEKANIPSESLGLILNGPHIHIANPLFKASRQIGNNNSDYDPIDLTIVPADYLARVKYTLACDRDEYVRRIPTVPWDGSKVTKHFRLAFRNMLPPTGARTLIGAIIPPDVAHINGILSTCFKKEPDLINASAIAQSLVGDYYVRSTGRNNLHGLWVNLPLLEDDEHKSLRVLALNCLTTAYANLWHSCWKKNFSKDKWTKHDHRLPNNFFNNLSEVWKYQCALRMEFERRQALLEIDVLVAKSINMTIEELCALYRLQFPVFYGYEQNTWYDQNGRIVFTINKGLPGVGLKRADWENIKNMASGEYSVQIIDDTQPGGPVERTITYVAPFDRCDREEDYRTAWAEFERRKKEQGS